MLSEQEMRDVLKNTNHMVRNSMYGAFWPELEQACRAIESAACAERDARIAELEQQLQAYKKHGVTCQTFRHFVSEPCAECNSPGRCAIKEQT